MENKPLSAWFIFLGKKTEKRSRGIVFGINSYNQRFQVFPEIQQTVVVQHQRRVVTEICLHKKQSKVYSLWRIYVIVCNLRNTHLVFDYISCMCKSCNLRCNQQ